MTLASVAGCTSSNDNGTTLAADDETTVTTILSDATPSDPAAAPPGAGSVDDQLVNLVKEKLDQVAQAAGATIDGDEMKLDSCPLSTIIGQMADLGFVDNSFGEETGIRVDENNATELGCVARMAADDTTGGWAMISYDLGSTQQVQDEMSELTQVEVPAELGGIAYQGEEREIVTAVWMRGGIAIMVGFRTGSREGQTDVTGSSPAPTITPASQAAMQFVFEHVSAWLEAFAAFDPYSVDLVTSST